MKQVVVWDHVTNEKRYISTRTRPVGTKLGKVLTYRERVLPLRPHELLFT